MYVYIYKYMRDLWDILDYGKTNLHNGLGSWGHFLQGNRTENLIPYPPSNWKQPWEYRVCFAPVLQEVQTIFIKREGYSLNQVPPEKNNCRGWNCHWRNERPLWKGFGWASGFQLLPASAFLPSQGGQGRPSEAHQSVWPTGPAVVTSLASTQAHFDFWRPHCVSVPPAAKNTSHTLLHRWPCSLVIYQPRRENAKEWWLIWTLFVL